MILTKKQLRRRIEHSAIPARLHSIAFAEITKHKRLMWETELIKADKAYKDAAEGYKARMSRTDTITHNEEHAIKTDVYAVNGRTGKIITKSGAPDYDTALHYACGLSIGARAFQKSAFAAIYEAGGKLVHTCDYFSDYKPVSGTEAGLLEAANQPNQ